MRGRGNRIAKLPVDVRRDVVSLRQAGKCPKDIWERLGLTKTSEQNAVTEICSEPGLRVYGHGIEVGGPIKAGRNAAAVIRP